MPTHHTSPGGDRDRGGESAEYARKLEEARRAIQIGVEEIERGNYVEVDDADLDADLDSLATGEEPPVGVWRGRPR